MITNQLMYTGNWQPNAASLDERGHPLKPYLPTPELIEAVNLAIYLERPLLLRGEPGCGKTQLARAVAAELSLPYKAWHVKSTSRAMDGFYIYDAVDRLRDSQLSVQLQRDPQPLDKFIRFGPIGKAFRAEQRTVVLIDEIDKADIDFPNDLLEALDEQSFSIHETDEIIKAHQPPIIFITSNDEKELPPAFLRRCLFHFLGFPDLARLESIVCAHFGVPFSFLVQLAVQRFLELRSHMEDDVVGAAKKVSTSELIDWFRVLVREKDDVAASRLEEGKRIPYGSTLIKRHEDAGFLDRPMGQSPNKP